MDLETSSGRIEVRVAGERDRTAFDAILAAHPWGHVQQSWLWGEFRQAFGWDPVRLIVEEVAGDGERRPRGAATVMSRRLPLPGTGFLYAPRGPAVDLADDRLRGPFLEAVRRIGRERGALFFKLDPEIGEGTAEGHRYVDAITAAGFRPAGRHEKFGGTQPRCQWRVDTELDEDALMERMAKDHRYHVRRSRRRGVTVRRVDGDGVETLTELLGETGRRQDIILRSPEYFRRMWKVMSPAGQAEIYVTFKDDEPIGAALPARLGDRVWGLYAGSSDRHRKLGTTYPLMWEMIRAGAERGDRFLDFGGVVPTEDKQAPEFSLYQFKRGFGGSLMTFIGEYDLPLRPALYPLWTHALPVAVKGVRRFAALRNGGRSTGSGDAGRSDDAGARPAPRGSAGKD